MTGPPNVERVPDWKQAHGPSIQRALACSQSKPHGGWFVLGASRTLAGTRPYRRSTPTSHLVDGVEVVTWSHRGNVAAAPAACPHLGAHLGGGRIEENGHLRCPWHGLALPGDPSARVDGQGRWSAFPVHDDGVLVWVQLAPRADDARHAPVLTKRPNQFFDAVVRREVAAEPVDVIANRLDPWHGVHFHPYAFSRLEVVAATDDALELRVAYRVTPRHEIEVEARFDCPDPRTVVMTITGGEGTGSVVETHATPIVRAAPGIVPRTAMIEATLATSDRPGFAHMLRGAVVARPMMAAMARRLWRDDARYAERIYALRSRGWKPGDH